MRESVIEKHLVARAKELGCEVRKVKWIGRNGAPDRLVMFPAILGKPPIWVELKAPGKAAEPHQLREHKRLRDYGQFVAVVDSIKGVEELFKC